MSNTSTVSASLPQFHPVFWQKTFSDGPTSARWSKLPSWGATGVLRVPAIYTASTRSISGFRTADTLYTPSISGFDTADTPVLAALLLPILPVLAVLRRSVLLILPALAIFRPSVVLILPVLAEQNVLDTLSILEVRSVVGASVQTCQDSGAVGMGLSIFQGCAFSPGTQNFRDTAFFTYSKEFHLFPQIRGKTGVIVVRDNKLSSPGSSPGGLIWCPLSPVAASCFVLNVLSPYLAGVIACQEE